MIVRVEVALLHPRVKERGCCLESPALQPFCAFSLVSFLPTSQGTSGSNPTRVRGSTRVFGDTVRKRLVVIRDLHITAAVQSTEGDRGRMSVLGSSRSSTPTRGRMISSGADLISDTRDHSRMHDLEYR